MTVGYCACGPTTFPERIGNVLGNLFTGILLFGATIWLLEVWLTRLDQQSSSLELNQVMSLSALHDAGGFVSLIERKIALQPQDLGDYAKFMSGQPHDAEKVARISAACATALRHELSDQVRQELLHSVGGNLCDVALMLPHEVSFTHRYQILNLGHSLINLADRGIHLIDEDLAHAFFVCFVSWLELHQHFQAEHATAWRDLQLAKRRMEDVEKTRT